jgi:hypothetical protein
LADSESLAKFEQASANPSLDGAERSAQTRRDLFLRKTTKKSEFEGTLLIRRQSIDGGADGGGLIGSIG